MGGVARAVDESCTVGAERRIELRTGSERDPLRRPALDRDTPYLLYCRSGTRSGQAAAIMADLGFNDVADVDGGVIAWAEAGLPLVAG